MNEMCLRLVELDDDVDRSVGNRTRAVLTITLAVSGQL